MPPAECWPGLHSLLGTYPCIFLCLLVTTLFILISDLTNFSVLILFCPFYDLLRIFLLLLLIRFFIIHCSFFQDIFLSWLWENLNNIGRNSPQEFWVLQCFPGPGFLVLLMLDFSVLTLAQWCLYLFSGITLGIILGPLSWFSLREKHTTWQEGANRRFARYGETSQYGKT